MNDGINLLNPNGYPIDLDLVGQSVRAIMAAHAKHQNAGLSVALTDSGTIQDLNRTYAHIDAPTDVLSFPADPAPYEAEITGVYLGDIVIAYDYVSNQVSNANLALSDVLCLLAIHGTLHLLGYTHDTPADKALMWAAQAAGLRSLNIDPAIVEAYGNLEYD